MRELNMMEVNAVSGAGIFDSLYSAAYMGLAGLATGAILGTKIGGGAGGGLLGFGLFGEAVGVVVGGAIGTIVGSGIGGMLGWNDSATAISLSNQAISNIVTSLSTAAA